MQAGMIEEDDLGGHPDDVSQDAAGGRLVRGLAGALAAGLAALAVVLLGAEVLASNIGVRGPGGLVLVGHLLAAVLAVGAAVIADRVRGALAVIAFVGVLVIAASTLWAFWLA